MSHIIQMLKIVLVKPFKLMELNLYHTDIWFLYYLIGLDLIILIPGIIIKYIHFH